MAPENHEARLARFSLDRRITVLVLLASALVVGMVAASGIRVELFPAGYDEPFLAVNVPWPDATPRELLDKVAVPLEDELGTVKGLDRTVSVSRVGSASVYMWFKQGTDMDIAYREVRDRVERARRIFPRDVDRVFVRKDDASGIPVAVFGVAVDPAVADHYNLLQQHVILPLERTDGVASVQVNGLEEKEILIELNRDRTAASGLNIFELAQQLGDDSFTMASGPVYQGGRKLMLRSVARYASVEELRQRPVAEGVRLGDIATVRYGEPEKEYRVRAMSKPAYAVIVMKEGEANARDVSERLEPTFAAIAADPAMAGSEMITLFDQGEVIGESLRVLLQSGAIGGILAGVVLFFFLRRLRLTLVVNLAVPLSLLIGLTVMFFSGETLNILSLLALMVSIGLLVDNSVVVAENIDRLHKLGCTRREAAIRGSGEIGLAIAMSTLTTVVVFLPVALVEGPAQFFLLRMAIPICVSILASLVVALVLIPLGIYLTLPTSQAARDRSDRPRYAGFIGRLRAGYEGSFGRLNRWYNGWLAAAVRHRFETVLLLLLVCGATGAVMAQQVKFVDVQENEEAGFEVDVEMPATYTLEESEEWFLQAEAIVQAHAGEFGLEGWFLWHDKEEGEVQGWFTTPRSTDLSPQEVTERVVELLPVRPGMELTTGDDSQHDGSEEEEVFRLRLLGEDPAALDRASEELANLLAGVPGVIGKRRDGESAPNELGLVIDRDRASRYGVDPQAVAGVVGAALRGYSLPRWRDEGKEIPVRVRFREEDRETLDALEDFQVATMAGGSLPLGALASPTMLESPAYIVRRDKKMSRSVAVDLSPDGVEATRERLWNVVRQYDLPEGVRFSAAAAETSFNDDMKGMMLALLLSVVFIYLLMGILFESAILPLSIVFTIPLAGLGVVWIHVVNRLDIDFLGAVGIVLLVGVVVNNGIVLVDTINRLRREDGVERGKAVLTAADQRFRPIMMTAITTVGGMVPLALNGRMDSGISYTSFALTLIGGMTTATLLTLLIVPVFYTLFDDLGVASRRAVVRGLSLLPRWGRARRGATG